MGWQAVLTGSAAAEAQRAVQEIAAAIEDHADPGDDVSLASGAAGFALLNAYLAVATDDTEAEERTFVWLERALEGVGGRGPSLYGGAAGVAWVAEHVSQLLGSADADPDDAMEQALLGMLGRSPWRSDFDLISGLAGYGVFALERLPRPRARACLEQVVARLEELAERTSEGITWHTPPELLPDHQRAVAPAGYYNLGVAHGVPGVVAVLAGAAAAGVAAERASSLAAGAVDWLLAQRLREGAPSSLPYWVAEGAVPNPARLAWCYGDPGAAAALLAADRALGETRWRRPALTLGGAVASRGREESGVEDASLCHGAAGLGHVFNRIHQSRGDAAVRNSAQGWFERTLELRGGDGRGFGGYASPPGREVYDGDGSGVLTGAAGVALALLAATTAVEPGWDRLFGLSLRAVPG
jgi:hypothetical protein